MQLTENFPWLEKNLESWPELATGNAPQALLICGSEDMGTKALAHYIAANKLKIKSFQFGADSTLTEEGQRVSDFLSITVPEGKKTIGIQSIRDALAFLVLQATGENGRVLIIHEVEKLTVQAANALLKTLEEPPPGTTIILTATSLFAVLPTIISRVQRLHVHKPNLTETVAWAKSKYGNKLQDSTLEAVASAYGLVGGNPHWIEELVIAQPGLLEQVCQSLERIIQSGGDSFDISSEWGVNDPIKCIDTLYILFLGFIREAATGEEQFDFPVVKPIRQTLANHSEDTLWQILETIQLALARITPRQQSDALLANEYLRAGAPAEARMTCLEMLDGIRRHLIH